jgi:A/G-specific adenine glycosylase
MPPPSTSSSRAASVRDLPRPDARQRFRRRLLAWYRQNGRDLPWRRTSDPYHILVSEVMLQQTQVDRVLPKYHEWLAKYPSLAALASADESDVTQTWRPLGYNIRPRRLHAIARESVARYGGALPSDAGTLLSFKGIGEYTAGAVLSFAFGKRAAILERRAGAVPRLHRPRQSEGARHAPAPVVGVAHGAAGTARLRLQPGPHGLRGDAVHGTQAEVPDLPDAPRLRRLPVQPRERTDRRAVTAPPPVVIVTAAVIERDGLFLVTRRPRGVHLEGCWEFPGGKCEAGEPLEACLRRELREELAADASVGAQIFEITHDYPDRSIRLHFFACTLLDEPAPALGQEMRWVPRADLAALDFPPADAQLIQILSAPAS